MSCRWPWIFVRARYNNATQTTKEASIVETPSGNRAPLRKWQPINRGWNGTEQRIIQQGTLTKLWITFVRVHTTGTLKKGMLNSTMWSIPTPSAYVSHIPRLFITRVFGLTSLWATPTFILLFCRQTKHSKTWFLEVVNKTVLLCILQGNTNSAFLFQNWIFNSMLLALSLLLFVKFTSNFWFLKM